MSIYKKQSDDCKTFETPDEFLKFYENNRKDIDETNTRSLNLKYKINGHTIGRKQGNIILYPKKFEDTTSVSLEQLKQAILQLNERLKIIEEQLSSTAVKQSSNFPLYYHK